MRIGDAPADSQPEPPEGEGQVLQRAIDLLDELYLADFMPEEFHPEYNSIRQSYSQLPR